MGTTDLAHWGETRQNRPDETETVSETSVPLCNESREELLHEDVSVPKQDVQIPPDSQMEREINKDVVARSPYNLRCGYT